MRSTAIALGLILAVCVATPRASDRPVQVFVRAPTSDGFVDPNDKRADSARDLQKRIGKTKGLALSETEEGADIVLVVAVRGSESQAGGAIAGSVGNVAVAVPIGGGTCSVRVTMELGDYRRDFIRNGPAWMDVARFLASDIGKWVAANRVQIAARKR